MKNFHYDKRIHAELIHTIGRAPKDEPKKLYVYESLDKLFENFDWSKTFNEPQVIFYDEVLHSEILVLIHSWLRTKCANIENIVLAVPTHLGLQQWWREYCDCTGEKSFKIQEIRFAYAYPNHSPTYVPDADFFLEHKNISNFFSFYGGSYSTLERCYVSLRMLELNDCGSIEFLSDFLPKSEIIDYAEFINYYMNQGEIELLDKLYDTFILNNRLLPKKYEFSHGSPDPREKMYGDYQWNVDRHCFASVVRETLIDQPYSTVTEKTLRTFLHSLVAIPTSCNAVKNLEEKGFWFPHDIIDYSYQDCKNFGERIILMIESIKNTVNKLSVSDLQIYYKDNIKNFMNNTQLAFEYMDKTNL